MSFLPADEIRSRFSAAMSEMYRQEVPLYGTLIEIVSGINAQVITDRPQAMDTEEAERLGAERHGAVRVGTAVELRVLARVFAVMGMEPVGYYDLAPAGIPVHSTAFRPTTSDSLTACPFRVFTSLLRLDLIADDQLREEAATILAGRRIVSQATLALVERAEANGGLAETDANAFVAGALDIFRWHADAIVDSTTYARLLASHRLVADIVSFRGPHINHLTPRTLDIDAVQAEMKARGIAAKETIEGPPRRSMPILLRQTSFHALSEAFVPLDAAEAGGGRTSHTARFGEVEQRGAALTPKGRALYDRCLEAARGGNVTLQQAFAAFPDDFEAMRQEGLAYARYTPTGATAQATPANIDGALAMGLIEAEPLTYEDFLPVSAAGIFRSNLGGAEPEGYGQAASQAAFEEALGRPVLDPFALYQAAEDSSREAAFTAVRTAKAVRVPGAARSGS